MDDEVELVGIENRLAREDPELTARMARLGAQLGRTANGRILWLWFAVLVIVTTALTAGVALLILRPPLSCPVHESENRSEPPASSYFVIATQPDPSRSSGAVP